MRLGGYFFLNLLGQGFFILCLGCFGGNLDVQNFGKGDTEARSPLDTHCLRHPWGLGCGGDLNGFCNPESSTETFYNQKRNACYNWGKIQGSFFHQGICGCPFGYRPIATPSRQSFYKFSHFTCVQNHIIDRLRVEFKVYIPLEYGQAKEMENSEDKTWSLDLFLEPTRKFSWDTTYTNNCYTEIPWGYFDNIEY